MEEYAIDTWVLPGPYIFPLKFRGEGTLGQSKKRKANSDKSTQKDTNSCRYLSVNSLYNISDQIRKVHKRVSRLHHGPGKPSTTCHSYVAQSDYEKYKEEQKKMDSEDEAPADWSAEDTESEDAESARGAISWCIFRETPFTLIFLYMQWGH
ncbi:hypothetical protein FXO37_23117 [Capsicum annuum]|nr:hypothetical protein FXO37_23117 [Capsicum annuum]